MSAPKYNMSVRFYNYLCDVVGTEEDVKTRRKLCAALEKVISNKNLTWITSGSKAEGLDLKGSDFDIMIVNKFTPVHERDSEVSYKEVVSMIMETDKTKVGFTRLILCDKYNLLKRLCGELVDNVWYYSSKLVKEVEMSDVSVLHGPCRSNQSGTLDVAISLHCKKWITVAKPWIDRPRSSWPTTELIESIIDHGVLFVPIGCKNSRNEHIEWRISFSVAEKLLIYSFTHTQLFCYALLKILLKDIISKKHPELLCSYFLKTITFWVSEDYPSSIWTPDKLLNCFMKCFRRLIHCVEYKTCLHYFIPEYNLFEDRFSSQDHVKLLSTLRVLYAFKWECVLRTQTLESFCHIQHYIQRKELNLVSQMEMVPCIYCSLKAFAIVDPKIFFNAVHCIVNCSRMDTSCIYAYLASLIIPQYVQNIMTNSVAKNNKHYYNSFKKCLSHFLIGSFAESVSTWLLVAALFYSSQQHQICLHIIRYALDKCTPDKILMTSPLDESSKDAFQKQSVHWDYSRNIAAVLKLFGNNSFRSVVFLGIPSEWLPYSEVFKQTKLNTIEIPVVVFAYFLRFLCYHHLNKDSDKLDAIEDLRATIREQYFVPLTLLKESNMCFEIASQMSGI